MIRELYTAALGLINQQTKLEVLANNISNAETTGYKREAVFERSLIDASQNLYNVPGDIENDDSPVGSFTDFSTGAFRKTDNPLDIALEQDGFFTLQDEAGNIYFTRNGHFTINASGNIISADGKMLMGDGGPLAVHRENFDNPMITPDPKAVKIRITTNGEVFANEYYIGTLLITSIENLETLRRISAQQFIATENTIANHLPTESIAVRQGWLEESNVNIIKEMVQMIELQRQFEAGTKVIQTNDKTLDDSIRIGRYF